MREYDVRVAINAAQDIANLAAYFEDLVDSASAERFENEVYATVETLKTFPSGNPIFDDATGVRRINMKNHKVAILYLVNDEQLKVIAVQVFHELQNPKTYRTKIRERLT